MAQRAEAASALADDELRQRVADWKSRFFAANWARYDLASSATASTLVDSGTEGKSADEQVQVDVLAPVVVSGSAIGPNEQPIEDLSNLSLAVLPPPVFESSSLDTTPEQEAAKVDHGIQKVVEEETEPAERAETADISVAKSEEAEAAEQQLVYSFKTEQTSTEIANAILQQRVESRDAALRDLTWRLVFEGRLGLAFQLVRESVAICF